MFCIVYIVYRVDDFEYIYRLLSLFEQVFRVGADLQLR